MEIIKIYDGVDACQQCLGWKRIADPGGESWKYWDELPERSKIAVRIGLVEPILCPRCKGTGIEPRND